MDIKLMINRAMIDAKRKGTTLKKVIMGTKEKEFFLEQMEDYVDPELTEEELKGAWSIKVEYVDEESHFEAVWESRYNELV